MRGKNGMASAPQTGIPLTHDNLSVLHVETPLPQCRARLSRKIDPHFARAVDFMLPDAVERTPDQAHPRLPGAFTLFAAHIGNLRHQSEIRLRLAGMPRLQPGGEGVSEDDTAAQALEHGSREQQRATGASRAFTLAPAAPRRQERVMFTGIVEATGRVAQLQATAEGGRMELCGVPFAGELAIGESVAVNGCCLTVVEAAGDSVKFDLLQQTLRLTNLGDLAPGDAVNLERAMHAGGRFSGHFVQGHVDGTGEILTWESSGQDYQLTVRLPAELHRLVIPRGSITLDGISLTAADLGRDSVTAWITPHTREVTNLRHTRAGKRVNVEADMLAKYVEQLLELRNQR
jgi:riboflavin synthase